MRDVCEKCLPTLPPLKINKQKPPRKGCYVIRIGLDWFYDGSRPRTQKSKLPAKRGTKYARMFTSLAPAKKNAIKYGGVVETL